MQRHDGRPHPQRSQPAPAGRIMANTICPLPLIGWRPSKIAGPNGEPPEGPTQVLCMGAPCAWFVGTGEDGSGRPIGVCAPSALTVVVSGLPATLDHFFNKGGDEDPKPPDPSELT